jgi:pimeloyl-ACP methyl ester carboxylesterase
MKKMIMVITGLLFIFSSVSPAKENSTKIDSEFLVKSGDAELYLKVRGQDIRKPVLLYLHGGPGEANGPLLFQAYVGPELEKHFVVAYLHQRNTCISPVAPATTLTVGQFVQDVDQVVDFLRDKFKKDKILLLGHSFGGGLGCLYLLKHQNKVEKFVSAGGAFSTSVIEENGYQVTMEMARKANDQDALDRLKTLGPPPYKMFMQGMVWRMLAMKLLAEKHEAMDRNLDMSKVISITGIDKTDPEWMKKSMTVAHTMWTELGTVNIEDRVKNITVPLLLITGAKDIMVPFRILKKGYENYGGPKEYVILEKSNHMMFVDQPDLFVSKVVEFFKR